MKTRRASPAGLRGAPRPGVHSVALTTRRPSLLLTRFILQVQLERFVCFVLFLIDVFTQKSFLKPCRAPRCDPGMQARAERHVCRPRAHPPERGSHAGRAPGALAGVSPARAARPSPPSSAVRPSHLCGDADPEPEDEGTSTALLPSELFLPLRLRLGPEFREIVHSPFSSPVLIRPLGDILAVQFLPPPK